MVIHNPNNWHWVNKDVRDWAKEYLEKTLVGISAEQGEVTAKVSKILSMDGDVDVSQRKGKVITLFDVQLQLEYQGNSKDAEDVGGTITVPEVAHDTDEDEYVFNIDIYADEASKQPVKDLVRSKIVPQLRTTLSQLGPALIAEHGKDLQHAGQANPTSQSTKQNTTSSSASMTNAKTSPSSKSPRIGAKGPSSVNTTSLTSTTEFQTTAEELYTTFTDPQRIAAFTRAPPKIFEGAHVGGQFELFGGNVSGEYLVLEKPTKILQKWRLAQWAPGHYSSLDIVFDQNDADGVTVMRVTWNGVPVGQEEVTRRNWEEYYVKSIKTTFGFGAIL